MQHPAPQQGFERDLLRAEGAHLQQHRSALHTERGTAQPACPQTGAGGVIAAGAHLQQHGRKGRKHRGQQQPAACRQQAKIQHKAA